METFKHPECLNGDNEEISGKGSSRKYLCHDTFSGGTTHADDDSSFTYTDRRYNYCYLCSTIDQHKAHNSTPNPPRIRARPRFGFIAPPPVVSYRHQHAPKLDIVVRDTLYKISVTTGNKTDAGTDANVFIGIIGNDGTLPQTLLTKSHGSAKFTFGRSTTETFFIKGPVLGNIRVLTVLHDGVLKSQGWYLEQVRIENMTSHETWICRCRKWLSLHHPDYRLKIDLEAKLLQPDLIDYSITVVTGNKIFSGTDAQVYVTMYGKLGRTKKVHLSDKGKRCFEKGSKDTFQVALGDVGELRRLRVEHDGSGTAPGWFLDKIIVTVKAKHFNFLCNDWISATEGDRKLWKELSARGSTQSNVKEKLTRYEVTVVTGDVTFAGTDANVYVVVNGRSCHTGKLALRNRRKNNFERGKTDIFTVHGDDVGEVRSLVIGHDNSGVGPGWFLDRVTLRRYITEPESTGRREQHPEKSKRKSLPNGLSDRAESMSRRSSQFSEFAQLERELLLEYEEGRKLAGRSKSDSENDSDDERKMIVDETSSRYDGIIYNENDDRRGSDSYEKAKDSTREESRGEPKFEQYGFICERWLARDEDDGAIERELVPESKRVYYE